MWLLLALACIDGPAKDPTDPTAPDPTTTDGTLEDGQQWRLTIVMDMIWDEGNLVKNYGGTADFSYLADEEGEGPCYDWLVGTIDDVTGEPDPGPYQCLGELLGDGHVDMTGSGDHTTFEGTWDPLVTGYYLINSDAGADELHVLLSGSASESLTYCGPQGCNTLNTSPYTERFLVLPDQGGHEVTETTTYDWGTVYETYHLSRF